MSESKGVATSPDTKLICPVCRHVHGEDVKLVEDDRREFLRCMLANRPFQKKYELFGGELVLRFGTLITTEARVLNYALRSRGESDLFSNNVDKLCIKLLYYIREVNGKEYQSPTASELKTGLSGSSDELFKELLQLYYDRFGEMPENLIAALVDAELMFLSLVGALGKSGLDENFYKGAGLR